MIVELTEKEIAVLREAYDAVTDHRNYKFRTNKGFNHYRGFLLRNVVRELKNSNAKVLGIDNNTINIKNQNNEKFNVIFDNSIDNQSWRLVDNGEERELDNDNYSGKGVEMPNYCADYSEMENKVKVEILKCDGSGNRIAFSKFDVRNIPGMVAWIKDFIKANYTNKPGDTIDESIWPFGSQYDRYKKAVIAKLTEFGVDTTTKTRELESWIRDFFVDKFSVSHCAQAIRDSVYGG